MQCESGSFGANENVQETRYLPLLFAYFHAYLQPFLYCYTDCGEEVKVEVGRKKLISIGQAMGLTLSQSNIH